MRKMYNAPEDRWDIVVCCFCKTLEEAERLSNEYEQDYIDRGYRKEYVFFYPVGNIYYDKWIN